MFLYVKFTLSIFSKNSTRFYFLPSYQKIMSRQNDPTIRYYNEAVTILKQATNLDNASRYNESISFYLKAKAKFLLVSVQPAASIQLKAISQNYIGQIDTRVDQLSNMNSNVANIPNNTNTNPQNANTTLNYRPESDFQNMISSSFVSVVQSKWDDIVCPATAKQELAQTIILPHKIPQFFQGGNKPFKCILLYGPHGAGKSYISKAIAYEIPNSTFLHMPSAKIIESIKNGCEYFFDLIIDQAKQRQPSIVYIDDIGSIFLDQSISPSIKSSILKLMEKLEADISRVVLIGSTATPWQIWPEALKCFTKRIYLPFPDADDRKLLIQNEIRNIKNSLNAQDIDKLSHATQYFSPSDISELVKKASAFHVQKIKKAQYFVKKGSSLATCSSSTPGAFKSSFEKFNEYERQSLLTQAIDISSFNEGLKAVRPSSSPEESRKFKNWK